MRISDWSSDVCSSDLQIPPLSVSGSLANSLKLQEEYAVEKITLDTVDMRLKRMIIERKIKCIQEGKASEECEGKKSPAGLTSPGAAKSEERRVGTECVSTCRYRWSQFHEQKESTSKYVSDHTNQKKTTNNTIK